MKAQVYLALAAMFGVAALVVRVVYPEQPVRVLWNGGLAIAFRYLAWRARWTWRAER